LVIKAAGFEIALVVAKHICDYVNLGLPKNMKRNVRESRKKNAFMCK